MLMWIINFNMQASPLAGGPAIDPLDFGYLPSIKEDDTPEVLRRKRNARQRYLAND